MFKTFSTAKEVFVNQDEGMFVALPITFDNTSLTLETETLGGRTYVKAGSVVKEGTVIRGITAERYDITNGPVTGRIVLEGYAWADELTDSAISAASSLPRIVLMPYKRNIQVKLVAEPTDLTAELSVTGAEWASTVKVADFTVSTLTLSSVEVQESGTLLLTFTGAGTGSLTAIADTAFDRDDEGVVTGLPITIKTVSA